MEYVCSCKIKNESLINIVIAKDEKEAINKFCSHIKNEVGYVNHICVCCSNLNKLKTI